MRTRQFALVFGIVFLAAGILGFIPGFSTAPHAHWPDLTADNSYRSLLGLFAVNMLHNIVHLAIGAWGIWAYGSLARARAYGKGVAIIYGVLTIMGLFPALNTTFGLVPIFGHDVWLHGVSTAVAAYFGFFRVEGGVDDRIGHRSGLGSPARV